MLSHRVPPVGLQEPGPYVVVTIRCQLRIHVIRHGTVHRKMAKTVFIHCVLCVNLDLCLICWALYFIIIVTIKTQSSSMLLLYSLIIRVPAYRPHQPGFSGKPVLSGQMQGWAQVQPVCERVRLRTQISHDINADQSYPISELHRRPGRPTCVSERLEQDIHE